MRTLRLFAMMIATFAAQSALAHTELTATVPADRATLAAVPANVELKFSAPVRLTALTIQQGDAARQSLGPLPSGNSEEFSVVLPAGLGEGHYVVTWRALSEDTHVVSGEFMFAVGTAAGPDVHGGHSPAAAQPGTTAPTETAAPAAHDAHGGAH